VLLVHPGGPFFRRRDEGSWSVPKGLVEEGEADHEAARRELEEETGLVLPDSAQLGDLGEVRQKGGKVVRAFSVEADFDLERLDSNTFEIEWPPRSGRRRSFPEIDRAAYYDLETAAHKILPAQAPFLERLARTLEGGTVAPGTGSSPSPTS
jgi:predicted NUDIX family NTP pyrophosphohydrolase